MAALTATSIIQSIAGNKRVAYVKLPAASNGDTWDATLGNIRASIDHVLCSPMDASTVAADSCSATWSGTTVTLNVAGTARAQALTVWGT
jgi:hypothetical protein